MNKKIPLSEKRPQGMDLTIKMEAMKKPRILAPVNYAGRSVLLLCVCGLLVFVGYVIYWKRYHAGEPFTRDTIQNERTPSR